ncbi:MAG: DUF429 domain-containing protein [Archangium sp.]|nr:DUF429 domain-containing protein [Archangium sp.]MDP3156367.1 DUF429 domain-containing protein [Archangium sp.]MDP3570411.1 DUF429 domain-containing protein [Archangium sp.]
MKLVGVDGCKSGWVAAESNQTLSRVTFRVHPTFASLLKSYQASPTILVVDMPIGLMEADARACDRAAREKLGSPRCTSVFSAPCRAVLKAKSYEEACERNLRARGKSLSRQSYGILPKILEVDRALSGGDFEWIFEGHPEVSFAVLTDEGRGLVHAKKTAAGERERLALLPGVLGRIEPDEERKKLSPARLGRDDLIDALACLSTAHRIFRKKALMLPAAPALKDKQGLRMAIVA